MNEYTVTISGVDHTLQAESEQELQARGYEVKEAQPGNKAAAPRNKAAAPTTKGTHRDGVGDGSSA